MLFAGNYMKKSVKEEKKMIREEYVYSAVVFESLAELKEESEKDYDLFPKQFVDFSLNESIEEIEAFLKSQDYDGEIRIFPDAEDFAYYEVYDGWYSGLINDELKKIDYNGAPDLFDFINFESLGYALENRMDDSIYLKLNEDGTVLELLDI